MQGKGMIAPGFFVAPAFKVFGWFGIMGVWCTIHGMQGYITIVWPQREYSEKFYLIPICGICTLKQLYILLNTLVSQHVQPSRYHSTLHGLWPISLLTCCERGLS